MARKTFDNELEELHKEFIEMGETIQKAITLSIEAFNNGDVELAKEVSENDYNVNKLEQEIQSRALGMLLRQQPVARDLRKISTALKVANDMERIGDQGADIADLVVRIAGNDGPVKSIKIERMCTLATEMVKSCVSAFIGDDEQMADRGIQTDDELDDLFDEIKSEIVKAIQNSEDNVDTINSCVDLLMMAKHFEKVGDHAVNIAQWTKFCMSGMLKDVRIL